MSDIYLITKERLLELLEAKLKLNCLERDGVDNWTWYMEGKYHFLAEVLNLPTEQIYELDYDFGDVAYCDLESFQKFN